MRTVSFRQMKDGTKAEYLFLHQLERDYIAQLPDRILDALRALDGGLAGYRVTRLEHCLQTATRAEADGADEEIIAGALIHDLGDDLAPENHSNYAAEIIRPYVRAEVTWVVEHHGLFQKVYYARFFGEDPELRELCPVLRKMGSGGLRPGLSDAVTRAFRAARSQDLLSPGIRPRRHRPDHMRRTR
jgi:predicted HD phosphohydrolase